MSNKLFKSFFAVAMVLEAAFGFASCVPQDEPAAADPKVEVSKTALTFSNAEGSDTLDVTATAGWKTEVAVDWVTVAPATGNGNKTITVSVSANDTDAKRETVLKVHAIHPEYGNWDTKKVTIIQSANEEVAVEEVALYSDDFDGKEATKTYGNNNGSWPYIDQFPEFVNKKGEASANVTYTGAGVSVRANSTSNSSYSDYAGSGSNNIFFGGGAYFQINNIAPLEGLNYKVTFGTEKYTQDGDSTFRNEEFIVSLSKDGEKWAPIEYTYAGVEPGRWNVATAEFTLAAATEKLYIKFEAKVASVYRLDDVKFYVGNGGQTIDLDNIEIVEPEKPTTDALYFENFDGQGAVKDGSGYWPYIADFPEFVNAVGPAAVNVSYEGYNATIRNNSNSNGSYSDYAGSGVNNIFFGKDNAWFAIKDLTLEPTQKDLILTFGGDKYLQNGNSTFSTSEFLVSISGDGEKWSNVEYTFAGTTDGRWNVATANFTLAEVPAKLYIKFTATAESAYRLDDVTLDLGEGGKVIDLANGTTEEPSNPDQPVDPDQPNVPANGVYESDSAFVCSADDSTNCNYGYEDTKIGTETVSGFKLGTSKKAGYFKSGVVSVEGAKYLNFYAVAWAGKSATLYFRVDGGETKSQALNAHDGATGNPPYTALTAEDKDHYSILLEGLTETSTIEFSTDASFSAAENTTSGRAIVFGMKLTDEPIGTETPGGGEEPENPENPVDPELPSTESLEALTNDAYYIFKPATEIAGGKWYAIVSENHAATALTSNYGYFKTIDGVERTNGIALPASCAFGFLTTTNGYTIQQYDNKYVYQTGTYDSFNVSDTLPADGGVWTVTVDGDKFTITNNSVNKFVQYDTKYGSYGSYSDARGNVPTLYELVEIDNSAMIVSVSSDSLLFAANGGTDAVEVVTNGDATLAATSNVDWVTASVSGNVVNVTVDANDVAEAREATITITYGEASKTIAVSQAAAGDVNEFVITFPGTPSSYTNAYTKAFTMTLDNAYEFEFANINNGQETSAWTEVRFGRKSDASVATIVTKTAVPYAVSSVKINFTKVGANLNSAKLVVASDADFTNVIEEVSGTPVVGEVSYAISTPAENCYYKLVYDMNADGANGNYRFSKITYAK